MDPLIGDRIVVRYRLGGEAPADWRPAPNPAGAGPSLSDVTGVLLDDGDPLVIERDGEPVRLPRSAVTSVRLLSARTVRNSEIRLVLAALAVDGPAGETETVAGWLCRLTPDGAAAPAVAVQTGAGAAGLAAVRQWYRDRGVTPVIALVERLLGRSAPDARPIGEEIAVLVEDPAGRRVPHSAPGTALVEASITGRPVRIAAVPASDRETGMALRQAGFGLHHSFVPSEI